MQIRPPGRSTPEDLGQFLVAVVPAGHGLAAAGRDGGIGALDGRLDVPLEHQIPRHRSS
jgi:hypothetical protein